ncbi:MULTISPECIES: M48 family metalloprotease [Metallosphaera]|uniref:Peptidase M48, Ste24p n=2 Tax=Metallosphaera sedula TaxID=43687 RepID=A4YD70_METS5|nr:MULTISPECIES: M48 family metalloprotease [Metallosphaera]ABP94372.1 peptidase M48, Ste24p [Metallosphaera sedula DSM 5348]AIM26359.1 peptidase M48, Ste24p [Metallosphaera sedula]AKV73368.1 peptidase M48 [Metallosphaera sedula]AKV75612.1 peptidase M48 [Metallosphaera sedula]AKV77858.1 peptidase M48 [Metallosphaera sedula]
MLLIIFILVCLSVLTGLYFSVPAISLKRYREINGESLTDLKLRTGLEFSVRVKEDPLVNALSLPNNVIVVTSGLVKEGTESLTSAIAHELGHLQGRHHLKTFILLLGITSISIYLLDVDVVLGLGLMLIGIVLVRYVSRHFEYSADRFAAELVGRERYTRLLALHMNPREKSSPLSTHPTVLNRLKKI